MLTSLSNLTVMGKIQKNINIFNQSEASRSNYKHKYKDMTNTPPFMKVVYHLGLSLFRKKFNCNKVSFAY